MKYFDAHCHVQFDPYDADREVLLARMREEEVGGLVVGVDRKSSEAAVALVQAAAHTTADQELSPGYPQDILGIKKAALYASVGLHPNDVFEESFDSDEYARLAQDGLVVAIGECGLDYYRPEEPEAAKQKQREVFAAHIELAVKVGKPLMIHSRPSKGTMDAYDDLVDVLESAKREHGDVLRGNVHFFVGDVDVARRLLALDFTLSYTAVITFARDYDETIRFAPLDHILSETDAPYVAPVSRRGKRNDPLAVIEVVQTLADVRGEDVDSVRLATVENAKKLFRI